MIFNIRSILKVILGGLLLLIFGSAVNAQDLQLTASHYGGTLELKWYPTSSEIWQSVKTRGVQLERTQLDASGNPIVSTKTLLNNQPILVKDSLWFAENGDLQNGYIDALGILLYDPDMQYEAGQLDAKEVEYNFLVREAQYEDDIAALVLGLYFEDTTMVDGLLYRYELSPFGGSTAFESVFVDMQSEMGSWESAPYEWQFTFPGGQSLTEMSGRLTEFEMDQTRLIAKAYGDSIILRWGPSNARFWEKANQEGYRLIRTRNNKGKMEIAEIGLIKAWPEEWIDADQERLRTDSFALMAAQMLYGINDNPPENMMQQSDLLENRFTFALFAAEKSAYAAEILGLRLVDDTVEPEATYTYYIESPASQSPMAAAIYEIENTPKNQPVPIGCYFESLEQEILLRWDKRSNDLNFSSYQIERSDDGGATFQVITPRPLVFLNNDKAPITECVFRDSVAENYKEYIYRIYGYDAFAERSQPTEVRAFAVDLTPPPKPRIIYGELAEALDTMTIKWTMDYDLPEDFAGYKVLLGPGMETEYDTLSGLLSATDSLYDYQVEYEDGKAFFFKVAAVDIHGNVTLSGVKYIHYPDLIPPEAPTNLAAEVNEDGVVTLVWDHSISEDVEGYWVFYAHDPEGTFTKSNDYMVKENRLLDTLPLNTLNQKIYYAVSAQDDNYNRSEPSFMIEVDRPDIVPPITPMMNPAFSQDTALFISWTPSGSPDVVSYDLLRRRFEEDTTWSVIYTYVGDTTGMNYRDKEIVPFQKYVYAVQARDDADNVSAPSHPITGELKYDYDQIQITDFEVQLEETERRVRLSWNYIPPAILPPDCHTYSFYIYKSVGGEQVKEIAQIIGSQLEFYDEEVLEGALQNYAIKAIYNNGIGTPISTILSVLSEGED
ncbi:MAG: fibronectin type III domain-containing protein [Bacteroidota bacterium]